jgi:4-amino-4-deoxy-L-arabinose transferase-like glycosyltransferase
LAYWVDKPLTQDELEYLMLGRNLASGNGFAYDAAASSPAEVPRQQFGRAPGYPAFLALVSVFAPLPANPQSVPASVKVAQTVVGAIGIILIGVLARRVAGPASGALAAVIASAYPPLVWICAYALSEALYSVLALLTVLTLWHFIDRAGARAATTGVGGVVLAGLIAGLAALTRPAMVLFLGLCAAWLAARRLRWPAVGFIVGAAAVLAPWTIRNAHESGRFVLIAPQGGVNFWMGNHLLARGEGDLAANPLLKTADIELRRQYPNLDAVQLEPIYYREAVTQIAAHPAWWVGLLARKFVYQWIPVGPSYRLHSARYYGASLVSYALVLPFAIAGLLRLRRHGRLPGALLLLAGSEVLLGLIFFPQERYRIPVIDPTLIICAAAWISSVFWRWR